MQTNEKHAEKISPVECEERDDVCSHKQVTELTPAAMRLLTGKWKAEIIWSLRKGKRRFSELHRDVPGITQHMLTLRLRELEQHGLVTRTMYLVVPPKVEYELTPAALALRSVFDEIQDWAEQHREQLNLSAKTTTS